MSKLKYLLSIFLLLFSITIANASQILGGGGGGGTNPSSTGITYWNGSSWGTSYTTTGSGSVLALSTSPSITTPTLTTPSTTNLTESTNIITPLLNGGQQAGFRNAIINGNFSIDQRNSHASVTVTAGAALAYNVDHWFAYSTGANVTEQSVAGPDAQHQYVMQFTGAASTTGIYLGQRVENVYSQQFAGKTVMLSLDMSDSVLTSATCVLSYANTLNTFGTVASPTVTQIGTKTFTITSTLTRYSQSFTVPSAAVTGLQVLCNVGAQTSGTWVVGNVQLEIAPATNPVATAFEYRPTPIELMMAYRYCYRWSSGANSYNYIALARTYSTTQATALIQFPTQMYSVPTLSTISINSANWDYAITAISLNSTSTDYLRTGLNVVGNFSTTAQCGAPGSGCVIALGTNGNASPVWIEWDAEL